MHTYRVPGDYTLEVPEWSVLTEIIVGGAGGGGAMSISIPKVHAGAGGGGGSSAIVNVNTHGRGTLKIHVGAGGSGQSSDNDGPAIQPGYLGIFKAKKGEDSQVTYGDLSITGRGGNPGIGATGGKGGSDDGSIIGYPLDEELIKLPGGKTFNFKYSSSCGGSGNDGEPLVSSYNESDLKTSFTSGNKGDDGIVCIAFWDALGITNIPTETLTAGGGGKGGNTSSNTA